MSNSSPANAQDQAAGQGAVSGSDPPAPGVRRPQAEVDADAESRSITGSMVRHAREVAREVNAQAILVYVDAMAGSQPELPPEDERRVIYITKTAAEDEEQKKMGRLAIRVPNVPLTRAGQIKIAALLALYRDLIETDDTIVFLSGVAESGSLDTVSVLRVGREFEMFLAPEDQKDLAPCSCPEVLERIIAIAVELGGEGREGKPVGTLFVLGDTERVQSLSRQLILNPFQGYPAETRSILDDRLKETVKELATIDGAFLVRSDGIIESAGTYLKVGGHPESDLPQGLGARHHAAAAITDVSEAIAITVSESTGTVTVFRKGRVLAQIEKPRGSATTPARG